MIVRYVMSKLVHYAARRLPVFGDEPLQPCTLRVLPTRHPVTGNARPRHIASDPNFDCGPVGISHKVRNVVIFVRNKRHLTENSSGLANRARAKPSETAAQGGCRWSG